MNKKINIITYAQGIINYRALYLLKLNCNTTVQIISNCNYESNHLIKIVKYSKNVKRIIKYLKLKWLDGIIIRIKIFGITDLFYLYRLKLYFKKNIDKNFQNYFVLIVPSFFILKLVPWIKNNFNNDIIVIDWQDLWSLDPTYSNQNNKWLFEKIKILEKKCFKIADLNILTNKEAQEFVITNNICELTKLKIIEHSFDKSDLHEFKTISTIKSKDEKIVVGFLGNLFKYPKVPGREIINAIKYCTDRMNELKFIIIGDTSTELSEYLKLINENSIQVLPKMTHKESILHLKECDYFLISLSDIPVSKTIMHGKLPHYLMLKKPILAFVPPDSFVAQTIQKTGAGIVFGNNKNWDLDLYNFICNRNKFVFNFNDNEIEKYNWTTKRLEWLNVFSIN